MKDKSPASLYGMLAKYFIAASLVLVAIYLIFCLVDPVFEKVGESIGIVSQALGAGRGDDFHSLAVLCIVFIAIIGLAKVLTRKR